MSKKTAVLGKVLRRLRRYIPAVVVALLLAAVYVAASLYIPVLVGRAIDNIVDAGKENFAAMSKELTAIAVCGGKDGVITGQFPPCGVCRQVMREFCEDDFTVYLVDKDGYETVTLADLLPHSFSPKKHMGLD